VWFNARFQKLADIFREQVNSILVDNSSSNGESFFTGSYVADTDKSFWLGRETLIGSVSIIIED